MSEKWKNCRRVRSGATTTRRSSAAFAFGRNLGLMP